MRVMQNAACTAAYKVIKKCGGHKKVAEWLSLDLSTVYRWTYPFERGGQDGLIPAMYQHELLDVAREHGIRLTPNDFFLMPDGSPWRPKPRVPAAEQQ